MVTWKVKAMNTVEPWDIIERDVAADSPADAMAISDFENDDYLAISARLGEIRGNDNSASAHAGGAA